MIESEQGFQNDIKHFVSIIISKIWLIIVCILCVLLPVIIITFKTLPVYEASTLIVCEEKKGVVTDLEMQGLSLTSTFVVNQVQEIESWSLISDVVDLLPDNVTFNFPLPDPLPPGFTREEYLVSIIQKNISAIIIPKSDVIKISAKAHNARASSTIANTVAEVLQQRNLNSRLGEVRNVRQTIEEQLTYFSKSVEDAERALRDFKENNKVTFLDRESEEIFKRITEAEVEFNRVKSLHKAAKERLLFIQNKLAKERRDLIPSITTITSPWADKLKEKLIDLEVQYTMLKVQNYNDDHPKMKSLQDQIEEAKKNLKEEALKIVQGENTIDPLSQIRQDLEEIATLEVDIHTYNAQEQTLESILNNYNELLKDMPDKELELGRLTRDKDVADNIYTMLLQKREEAKINEAERAGNIRIIDPALPPKTPIKPRKKFNLIIGFLFGSIFGVGMALIIELFNNTVKTADEVEKNTGLEVISTIPRNQNIYKQTRKPTLFSSLHKKNPHASPELISEYDIRSPWTEAFRNLRTNIQFTRKDSKIKSLLVTSANPEEGKSIIAANLAVVTAQQGFKTLLIDADLRKPVLHNYFGLEVVPGLMEILGAYSNLNGYPAERYQNLNIDKQNNNDGIRNIIRKSIHSTGIQNLFIITSGKIPPNPSEILGSMSMMNLFLMLRDYYDMVIFDMPPVGVVTDAAIVAQESDGIILVVRAGKSKLKDIIRSKRLIEKVKRDHVVGAVMNNIDIRTNFSSYYSYYHYGSDLKTENRKSYKIKEKIISNVKAVTEVFIKRIERIRGLKPAFREKPGHHIPEPVAKEELKTKTGKVKAEIKKEPGKVVKKAVKKGRTPPVPEPVQKVAAKPKTGKVKIEIKNEPGKVVKKAVKKGQTPPVPKPVQKVAAKPKTSKVKIEIKKEPGKVVKKAVKKGQTSSVPESTQKVAAKPKTGKVKTEIKKESDKKVVKKSVKKDQAQDIPKPVKKESPKRNLQSKVALTKDKGKTVRKSKGK